MPIYEYECSECTKVIEVIAKISDPAPESCPHCGKATLQKLMSPSAFHLKGGGWYKDLYASRGSKGTGGDTASPAAKEDSKKDSVSSVEGSKDSSKA